MFERSDYLLPSDLFRSLHACLVAVSALPATGHADDADRLLYLLPPEDAEGGPMLVRLDLEELEAAHECVNALIGEPEAEELRLVASALKDGLPPTCFCQ